MPRGAGTGRDRVAAALAWVSVLTAFAASAGVGLGMGRGVAHAHGAPAGAAGAQAAPAACPAVTTQVGALSDAATFAPLGRWTWRTRGTAAVTAVLGALAPGVVGVRERTRAGDVVPAVLSLVRGTVTPIPVAPYGNPPVSVAANRLLVDLDGPVAFATGPNPVWQERGAANGTYGQGAIVGLTDVANPATGAAVLLTPTTGETLFDRPLLPPPAALPGADTPPIWLPVTVTCSGDMAYELSAGALAGRTSSAILWRVTALDLASASRLWQRDLAVSVGPAALARWERNPQQTLVLAGATPRGLAVVLDGLSGELVELGAANGDVRWRVTTGPIGQAVTNGNVLGIQAPSGGPVLLRSMATGRVVGRVFAGGGVLRWASQNALLFAVGHTFRTVTWQGRRLGAFAAPGPGPAQDTVLDEGPAGVFAFSSQVDRTGRVTGIELVRIASGVLAASPPPAVLWRVVARLPVAGTVTALAMDPRGTELAVATRNPDAVTVVGVDDPAHVRLHIALSAVPAALVWPAGPDPVVTLAPCSRPGTACSGEAVTDVITPGRAIPVVTGVGSLALAPVPGRDAVLVAASGAGTVAEVALAGAHSRVACTFAVGGGALTAVATDAAGRLAAVANATAGQVALLNLHAGVVFARAQVSYVPVSLAFVPGVPYVAVAESRGENVALVHDTNGTVPVALRTASFPGPVAVSGALSLLVAGSLARQGLSLVPYLAVPTSHGAFSVGASPLKWLPLGPPAAGAVTAVVPVAGGQEVLATAAHGLSVVSLGEARVVERILPLSLGGVPMLVTAASSGYTAAVASAHRVTLLFAGGDLP